MEEAIADARVTFVKDAGWRVKLGRFDKFAAEVRHVSHDTRQKIPNHHHTTF